MTTYALRSTEVPQDQVRALIKDHELRKMIHRSIAATPYCPDSVHGAGHGCDSCVAASVTLDVEQFMLAAQTMPASVTTDHDVTISITIDGIKAVFDCQATRYSACRMNCTVEGCDEDYVVEYRVDQYEHIASNGATHVLREHDCLVLEWLNEDDWLDAYRGASRPLSSGPVLVEWATSRGYLWRYPVDAT